MTPSVEQTVLLIQAIAMVGGGFYFTGQVVANLRELRRIAEDHENRLRDGGL